MAQKIGCRSFRRDMNSMTPSGEDRGGSCFDTIRPAIHTLGFQMYILVYVIWYQAVKGFMQAAHKVLLHQIEYSYGMDQVGHHYPAV